MVCIPIHDGWECPFRFASVRGIKHGHFYAHVVATICILVRSRSQGRYCIANKLSSHHWATFGHLYIWQFPWDLTLTGVLEGIASGNDNKNWLTKSYTAQMCAVLTSEFTASNFIFEDSSLLWFRIHIKQPVYSLFLNCVLL